MPTTTNRVRLVLDGARRFVRGIDTASAAIDQNNDALKAAADSANKQARVFSGVRAMLQRVSNGIAQSMSTSFDSFNQLKVSFKGATDAIKSGIGNIDKLAQSLFAIPPPAIAAADALKKASEAAKAKSEPFEIPVNEESASKLKTLVDEIASTSLQPMSAVAEKVNGLMGNLANADLPKVTERLASLDDAIKPFEDRVKLIKTQFNALSGPANRALENIREQIEAQATAADKGDEKAIKLLRSLREQENVLSESLKEQEDILDNAEHQLDLVRAQQAQERSVLELRRDQLKVSKQITDEQQEAQKQQSGIIGKLSGFLNRFKGGLSQTAGDIADTFDDLGLSLGGITQNIRGGVNGIDSLGKALLSIPPPALAAAAAIGGVALAVAGIVALGARGDLFTGVANSFAQITSQAGILSDTLLNNLQAAADGTIRDFELMRQANFALTGASGEVAQAFGDQLPRFLEFARIQAVATGQSLDFLFESIVLGVKRGSPLIIDNLGLVVNLTDVYEDYAASIGVAVTALTDEQKRLALINAIGAEAASAIEAAGGTTLTAADKISRSQVDIANALDRVGQAVLPLYHLMLDAMNDITRAVSEAAQRIAPVIQFISELFAFIIGGLARLFGFFRSFGNRLFGLFLKPFVDIGNAVLSFFGGFVREMLIAGARLMGEFANGILHGLNLYVLPAVISVAKLIADFLVGQSPPPVGPLSMIDEGGANVLQAWVDGFAASSLQPISAVADEVSMLMGDIATASLPQVETRLAGLDRAIAPFENRVKLLKANFEALREPADRALNAVNSQIEGQLQALANGDEQAAQLVRTLDAQGASIRRAVSAQETQLGNAELQLALARSQQAQERAALNIRLDQLKAIEATATAQKSVAKSAQSAAQAAGTAATGGAIDEGLGEGPIAIPQGEAAITPFENFIGDLGEAFSGGIDQSQLKLFEQNQFLLDKQLDRIEGANFADRLGGMFGDIGASFRDNFVTPAREKIDEVVDYITDPVLTGSLAASFIALPSNVSIWLGGLGESIRANLSAPFTSGIETVTGLISNGQLVGSIGAALISLPIRLPIWLSDLMTSFDENLVTPIRMSVGNAISFLTDPDYEGGFANKLTRFFTGGGDQEGSLAAIINTAVNIISSLPARAVDALSGFGLTIWALFATPFLEAINGIIDGINNFIRGFADMVANLRQVVLDLTGIDIGVEIPQLSRVSVAPPAFLSQNVQGFARGGFGRGLMRVGEEGEEYIFSSERLGVLPNEIVRLADAVNRVFMSPSIRQVPFASGGGGAGSVDNSQSTTMNVNFNDRDGDAMLLQRLAMLLRTSN